MTPCFDGCWMTVAGWAHGLSPCALPGSAELLARPQMATQLKEPWLQARGRSRRHAGAGAGSPPHTGR